LWVNGAPVKNATLSNGNFTINGLATITKATDKVEVVAVNASFKEVNRKTVQAGE
ncbi:immunoglobulin-like domain-containing protein, partial [Listeria cornellensis]